MREAEAFEPGAAVFRMPLELADPGEAYEL
jgi:hypothetical protein